MLIKCLKWSSRILVALMLILALALAGVRLFGLQIYTVLSGSMESSYPTGSVLYVCKTDTKELAVGDAITYRLSNGTVATHRIVEIKKQGDTLQFRTKGDSNKTVDPVPVAEGQVLGKALFAIPYLGYLAAYIQNPPGSYLAIAVCGVIILYVLIVSAVEDRFKKGDTNNEKAG